MEIKCAYDKIVNLSELVEHPLNDNKHTEEHAKALAKFISVRGIRHPIIVSNRSGFIAAGHLRLWAARIPGLESYPVDFQDFESEADEYAFLSGDNNIARYAEFDESKFVANLEKLDIKLDTVDFGEFGLIDFIPVLAEDGELPDISDSEDPEIGQLAFMVHNDQREIIDRVVHRVASTEDVDTSQNTNKNSAAITLICLEYEQRNKG